MEYSRVHLPPWVYGRVHLPPWVYGREDQTRVNTAGRTKPGLIRQEGCKPRLYGRKGKPRLYGREDLPREVYGRVPTQVIHPGIYTRYTPSSRVHLASPRFMLGVRAVTAGYAGAQ